MSHMRQFLKGTFGLFVVAAFANGSAAQAALTIQSFSASGAVQPLSPYSGSQSFSDSSSALSYSNSLQNYSYSKSLTRSAVHVDASSTNVTTWGDSAVDADISINASVLRGTINSAVSLRSGNFVKPGGATANVSLSTLTLDRVVFSGITPGNTAQILITNYAANILNQSIASTGSWTSQNLGGFFAYTSHALLYEDPSKVFGQSVAKYNSGQWKVCDNSNQCSGQNLFSTGSLSRSFTVTVDHDDVLFIQNSLLLSSNVGTSFTSFGGGSSSSSVSRGYDFGHSGYTFLQVLTPGVNYVADSGVRYLTGVPGVPEPASWTFMIAGFGMIGGAMRRRVATA